MEKEYLSIYVERNEKEELPLSKGSFDSYIEKAMSQVVNVEVNIISKEIVKSISKVRNILKEIPDDEDLNIDEVEFSLIIDGNGKVSLFSSLESTAAVKSGLTFRMKSTSK